MADLKAKLLIVDDEPSIRTLLTQIFEPLGYPVRVAEDGFAALEEIRKEAPDVLLSDLNMPRMSGFELLYVVRRKLPGIYVIASSGAFSGNAVPHGIAADAFYEKATGLASLVAMVNSAAHIDQVRAGVAASTPIWISPWEGENGPCGQALISCTECLRSFPLEIGTADFVIHEADCVFCQSKIYYATVHPMSPGFPHSFAVPVAEASPMVLDTVL